MHLHSDLDLFYTLLGELEERIGGRRRLGESHGGMEWQFRDPPGDAKGQIHFPCGQHFGRIAALEAKLNRLDGQGIDRADDRDDFGVLLFAAATGKHACHKNGYEYRPDPHEFPQGVTNSFSDRFV